MSTRVQPVGRVHLRSKISRSAGTLSTSEKWTRFFIVVIVCLWAASFVIGFQTSLTVLTLFGFVTAILGLRVPIAGLLGIGILSGLDTLTRVYLLSGGLLRWNTLNYWLLVAMVFYGLFLLKLRDPMSRLMQAFVALLVVELVISPSLSDGIQEILNIVTTFGLLGYIAFAVKKDENVLYSLGLVVGILGAVGGLVFYLQEGSIPYINPNAWAYFPLTALFAICLGFPFARSHPRGKLAFLIFAGINLIWIYLTGSRGGMLSAVVCLVYLILETRSFSWNTFLLVCMVIFGYWFSLQFAEQQAYTLSRITKIFNPQYTLNEITSGRTNIAEIGLEIFKQNPLGVGTGGFQTAMRAYESNYQAHSAWIKVLAENGIPGMLLFVAYMVSFALVGWRTKQRDLILIGFFVTISFATAFLSKEFQGKSLWLLAAGGTVLLKREETLHDIQEQVGRSKVRRFNRFGRNGRLKADNKIRRTNRLTRLGRRRYG